MNKEVERKLAELVENARVNGPGAVFTVLHMLHGAYLSGGHNDFARHCSQYNLFKGSGELKTKADLIPPSEEPSSGGMVQ
jgi:hypothetical protein